MRFLRNKKIIKSVKNCALHQCFPVFLNFHLGFFIQGFPKLLRFQSHHDRILKKCLKRLKKHLVGSFENLVLLTFSALFV